MTGPDLELVAKRLRMNDDRVARVETSVGPVWVKRQRPARSRWRARALDLLARGFGVPLLRAVPTHGGLRGQAIEVTRIERLRAAGVRVPELLHVARGFIVLRHLCGPSLVHLIERGDAAGFAAWRLGLDAICDAHARGGYLSHAAARNFVADETGLTMIDFEDDPLEVMTLAEAQSRDWLAYLHSTLWLLDRSFADARVAIAERLEREAGAVRALVDGAGRRLSVLRHLPDSRRRWGREVVGARALALALSSPTQVVVEAS